MRSPARATSSTVRDWPGSKRTAVPAAMFKPASVGELAIEAQRVVGLEEVIMRAHLDRAVSLLVTSIVDFARPLFDLDVARGELSSRRGS